MNRIGKLLVESGGYRDLDTPTILASGELGVYFINTERLCRDGGEFKGFGDDSSAMWAHAVQQSNTVPEFNEVVDILSERVLAVLNDYMPHCAVSGGQRRDWIFSAPVAEFLSLDHVSLYKDGRVEVLDTAGHPKERDLSGVYVCHVVDLLTKGSSCYRVEDGVEKGWIPMLREKGAVVQDLVAVVTRYQGGEEMLRDQGVRAASFVGIDDDFLREHSSVPERALEYSRSPRRWSEDYLTHHGALGLLSHFSPDAEKADKAKAFVARYRDFLTATRHFEELREAVKGNYGVDIADW